MTIPAPGDTTPATYLEESAAELRKARDANEERRELAAELRAGKLRTDDIDREVAARSMELGLAFLAAAAVERGLPPCCHHARPEPVQP